MKVICLAFNNNGVTCTRSAERPGQPSSSMPMVIGCRTRIIAPCAPRHEVRVLRKHIHKLACDISAMHAVARPPLPSSPHCAPVTTHAPACIRKWWEPDQVDHSRHARCSGPSGRCMVVSVAMMTMLTEIYHRGPGLLALEAITRKLTHCTRT